MIEPYYIDSDCTLYNAKWEEVLPQLPERSVDMVLCDLPYGLTNLEWDYRQDIDRLCLEWERIAKPASVIALFCVQPFTTDLMNAMRGKFRHELIWKKNRTTGIFAAAPMRNHENILIFAEQGHYTFNPQPTKRTADSHKRNGQRSAGSGIYGGTNLESRPIRTEWGNPKSVLEFRSVHTVGDGATIHPTQKPVDLCAWLIRTYTNEGDLVLDNTCGVGTTLVAAKQTGRRSIGVESELKYCELAVKERLNRPLPLFDDERANYEQQQIFS